jgi:hypothetical protein
MDPVAFTELCRVCQTEVTLLISPGKNNECLTDEIEICYE